MRDIEELTDEATYHFILTALWSGSCNGTSRIEHECRGEDCDTSLENLGYEGCDVTGRSQRKIREIVQAFIVTCRNERPNCFDRMTGEQLGYDFYLTANGHGAGFWDRGLGELGNWLTSIANPYGEMGIYVGDDGFLYFHP
jgi:hypothetical protein